MDARERYKRVSKKAVKVGGMCISSVVHTQKANITWASGIAMAHGTSLAALHIEDTRFHPYLL